MGESSERVYRLAHAYRDTGTLKDPGDQFMRWINLPESGIRNTGGVRTLRYAELDVPVHAYLVLVTNRRSRGSVANPWDDLIDLRHGRIVYWGDAKFRRDKGVLDFVGNRALRDAYLRVVDRDLDLVPPILHFSREDPGWVRFNGLCVLDRLDLAFFEHDGQPVRNLKAHLTVLEQDVVGLEWLQRRVRATSRADLVGDGPGAWRDYQAGITRRLHVYAPFVRPKEGQLPRLGSEDDAVLDQVVRMDPTTFEAAVVTVLRQLTELRHDIRRTKPTGDGGFDFYGNFTMPPPLGYEIDFLGEAKRFSRATPVTPKDISRLVARLGRGQYGIFVTTSYFTKQAQREVLEDGYPTALISGGDLVGMMRELRLAEGRTVVPAWSSVVDREVEYGLVQGPLAVAAEEPGRYD